MSENQPTTESSETQVFGIFTIFYCKTERVLNIRKLRDILTMTLENHGNILFVYIKGFLPNIVKHISETNIPALRLSGVLFGVYKDVHI